MGLKNHIDEFERAVKEIEEFIYQVIGLNKYLIW